MEEWNISRFERYAALKEREVMYEEFMTEDADYIIVAFGIVARIAKNAIKEARENGIKVGLIRPITLFPFPEKALAAAAEKAKAFLSVELNMGQMADDVKLAVKCKKPVYFYGRTGGVLMRPEDIVDALVRLEKGEAKEW